ncbi:MAG: ImmA/IrrE family metallo-endopeptidase [Verrucomicrobiales bacterium]|nr:ImmA/IrrE family metallo-endopeptidase [Verrucomicrobiales bacterium]
MTQYQEPIATGQPKAFIENLAGQIAGRLNFQAGGDLAEIVKRLGGEIEVFFPEKDKASGSIRVDGPKKFKIFLSPYTGALRDRFTIAHELGHYFLHSLAGKKKIEIKREGSNRLEWEANWFAAGFLMPEEAFKEQCRKLHGELVVLASHFNVSTHTIAIRKKSFGIQG